MTQATSEVVGFEFATCGVVVRLAGGTNVADIEAVGGVAAREVDAVGCVVAAVERTRLAFDDGALARRGKFWRARLGNDGAANAVATGAHRGDASVNL